MVNLSQWAVVGMVGLATGAAWAQSPPVANDAAIIGKAVQQAYPKLGVLCTGGAEAVRSAVTEVLPDVGKQLKTNAKTAAEAAQKRILSGCPY